MSDSERKLTDDGNWLLHPFGGYRIGDTIEQLRDYKDYITRGESRNSSKHMRQYMDLILEQENADSANQAVSERLRSYTDTSIGGCDVLNPLWQFCRNDDIVWPVDMVDSTGRGLSRFYKEHYYATQHILWVSYGVPQYRGLTDFYKNAADPTLADIMTSNDMSIAKKIGKLITSGFVFAFKLPVLPITGSFSLMNKIGKALSTNNVSKYYEMVPRMDLYYKTVATILAHLVVDMGLLPNEDNKVTPKDLPYALRKGADIIYVLDRRRHREHKPPANMTKLEALIDKAKKGASNYFETYANAAMREHMFVGWRIERGTEMTESVSNNIGEPAIASKLKSMVDTAKDAQISMARGNFGSGILETIGKGLHEFIQGGAEALGNTLDLGPAISIITRGTAYFDIPNVFKDSSFSTNDFSFQIQLRARSADPLVVYQCIYIPLAMWIAAAFPIGVGENTYTSPYLLQAYSRGLFSIKTGIIKSLSIKRGLSEYGWGRNGLPTAVDLNVTIADMSPAMYVPMYANNPKSLLKGGDGMRTYLATLSGLGITDLIDKYENLKRRWATMIEIDKRTLIGINYWAESFGAKKSVQSISQLLFHKHWRTPDQLKFGNIRGNLSSR